MRSMANLSTIMEPTSHTCWKQKHTTTTKHWIKLQFSCKREDKIRLQKHTETTDLNKEELMGPQTVGSAALEHWDPLNMVSVRRRGPSKGPVIVEAECIKGAQKILGARSPWSDTPLTLRQEGGPSRYSERLHRFTWSLEEGITLHMESEWRWGWWGGGVRVGMGWEGGWGAWEGERAEGREGQRGNWDWYVKQ